MCYSNVPAWIIACAVLHNLLLQNTVFGAMSIFPVEVQAGKYGGSTSLTFTHIIKDRRTSCVASLKCSFLDFSAFCYATRNAEIVSLLYNITTKLIFVNDLSYCHNHLHVAFHPAGL